MLKKRNAVFEEDGEPRHALTLTLALTLILTITLTLTFTLALTRHPQRLRFHRPIHRHGRGGAARRAHFLGRRHHGHPGRQGELL